MKFIGVDLGWSSGASGLACLQYSEDRLKLLDLTRLETIEEILAWIDRHLPATEMGMIAVDAPTLIPNRVGMRLPDRLTHKYFGRYHAGCYPANGGMVFATRTVGFGNTLREKGFAHAPKIEPKKRGRYQIEVFPHPATVNLFNLSSILKYKKGKLVDRLVGLKRLHQYIREILPDLQPSLELDALDSFPLPNIEPKLTTKEFKSLEDRLDSVICAYVAAYWWFWGEERNLVLGDETTGYIVIPERVDRSIDN
jgi:predicted RNase H-like nuclease